MRRHGRLLRRMSRVATLIVVFSATILGVVGCGDRAAEPARGGTLTGKRWQLSSYQSGGKKKQVPSGVTSEIVFADGTAGGTAGVNQFSAPYDTSGGGKIAFGKISTTLMAGPPEATAVEDAVYAGLGLATTYYADDTSLTLYGRNDDELLVYDAVEKAALVGTEWLVTNYNNGTQAIVSTLDDVDLTAVFDESGKVSGFSGVNTYSGEYTLSGSDIHIGPLATTKMAGPQELMDQESQYLAALETAATVIIVGDKCELHTADGAIAVKLISE